MARATPPMPPPTMAIAKGFCGAEEPMLKMRTGLDSIDWKPFERHGDDDYEEATSS